MLDRLQIPSKIMDVDNLEEKGAYCKTTWGVCNYEKSVEMSGWGMQP